MYRKNVDIGGKARRPSRFARIVEWFLRGRLPFTWAIARFGRDDRRIEESINLAGEDDPVGGFSYPAAGLEEANLTEEQREEAVRRIKNRPRVR